MAIWDYQLVLFPNGNQPRLTEDGMDFVGPNSFKFTQAIEILENLEFVKNEPSLKSWNSFDDRCYYLYNDGSFKVEIELNTGTEFERADQISVRTNIYKDEGGISEALSICKTLCDSLNLRCWGMKLRKDIHMNNAQDVNATINHFYSLRNKN